MIEFAVIRENLIGSLQDSFKASLRNFVLKGSGRYGIYRRLDCDSIYLRNGHPRNIFTCPTYLMHTYTKCHQEAHVTRICIGEEVQYTDRKGKFINYHSLKKIVNLSSDWRLQSHGLK